MKCRFSQRNLSGSRVRQAGASHVKLLLLLLCVAAAGWWIVTRGVAVQARAQDVAGETRASSTAESPYAKVMPKRPAEQLLGTTVMGHSMLADPVNQAILVLVFVLGGMLGVRKLMALSRVGLEPALAGASADLTIGAGPAGGNLAEANGSDVSSELESALHGGNDDGGTANAGELEADEELVVNEHAEGLAKHAPEHIATMSDRLLELEAEPTTKAREEVFEEIYVGMRSLGQGAKCAGATELQRLASTTEELVKKVMEQPTLATESVYQTLMGGLSLMRELCVLKRRASRLQAPIRVLAVDDDLISQRTLATALQPCVDALDVAGNGKLAMQKAEGQKFDLIFMDVVMPQMDGFEACAKIREGRNRGTPVVFVTGKGDRESTRKARESGGNGFIAKPILPAEMALVALSVTWRSRLTQLNSSGTRVAKPSVSVCKRP